MSAYVIDKKGEIHMVDDVALCFLHVCELLNLQDHNKTTHILVVFVCSVYSDSQTNDSYEPVLLKNSSKRPKSPRVIGLNRFDETFANRNCECSDQIYCTFY